MKALIVNGSGMENLSVSEVAAPSISAGQVLVRNRMAGVNPIDVRSVMDPLSVRPMPREPEKARIPGAEFAGEVVEIGSGVDNLSVGDRVSVYNRVFDGTCDMCRSGNENLCRDGFILGTISNGGFAEYSAINARNAVRIPDDLSWEMAASLPVAALTAYHAVMRASVKGSDTCVVLGGSGNTGMFALQFAKAMGAKTIAVSRKSWLGQYGADFTVDANGAAEFVSKLTGGAMGSVVINSLGERFWQAGLSLLGARGRLVTFGTLTGRNVGFDIMNAYTKELAILGSTGGTMREFTGLAGDSMRYKVKVWKRFGLSDGRKALEALDSAERDGRVMLAL